MTRILVAEDDKNLRENILFLLNKSGYQADGANNGLEALEKYQQKNYNMIISDIMMPYMDGFELYSNIKNQTDIEMIPFIFLTAKADRDSIRSGMELGVDDYLTKPFIARELLNAVKTRLNKNELLKRSKSAEVLKSEFLAQISHEIRTPLQAINSLISLLNMDHSNLTADQTDELLKLIGNSGERLTRIIEMLIFISELRSGTYRKVMEPVNIADDIIGRLLNERYIQMINEKGLKLEIINDAVNTVVTSDEESLLKVFDHILDNAVKFTEKGKISIKYTISEDKLKIMIADTGIGISEDFLEKIFEPFSQEESGYSRRYEGAGLGLSLSKHFCELNNIDLNISSSKGKGTLVETGFFIYK